jgi:dTDP-4-dehydrorhamnose reductase
MKIAVIGGNGQLGMDVVSAFSARGESVTSLTHAEIELSSMESVKACLDGRELDLVVNTAALHHVENCERQPELAFAVNAVGARNLAVVTRELGATLIHISTDYVFDGRKREPYIETDTPLPLNVYGNSKLAGEHFVRTINPRHFVLRTSALYGKHPCRAKGGSNFVDLMVRLGRERGRVRVVDCEFVSPTSTFDVARQIVALAGCEAFGLYHATAEGSCSWHEFAREIFAAADVPAQVDVASPSEFPSKVPRPLYSVLDNRRLKTEGINLFPSWQAGLRGYFAPTAVAVAS